MPKPNNPKGINQYTKSGGSKSKRTGVGGAALNAKGFRKVPKKVTQSSPLPGAGYDALSNGGVRKTRQKGPKPVRL